MRGLPDAFQVLSKRLEAAHKRIAHGVSEFAKWFKCEFTLNGDYEGRPMDERVWIECANDLIAHRDTVALSHLLDIAQRSAAMLLLRSCAFRKPRRRALSRWKNIQ
uniref:Uncharacterized protein n=1 Tax=Neobodo designis TaxID=312471 RepID=A0A7S1QFS0_NEODS|mmetsp:Transcript_42761/g.132068  ORF Transcript_42761/g.132068 Transcript_42761/m.132068 type:complete len:106 (+) Transcript_42761:267-584(+)